MTKKDLKQVEEIVEKVLDDMIYQHDSITLHGSNETMFSLAML